MKSHDYRNERPEPPAPIEEVWRIQLARGGTRTIVTRAPVGHIRVNAPVSGIVEIDAWPIERGCDESTTPA